MRGTSEVSSWYEIDASGARILGHSFRPPHIDPKTWVKLSEERKMEEMQKHRDAVPSAPRVSACAPLGLLGFNKAMAAQVVEWSNKDHKLQEPTSLNDYCVQEDRAHELEPELAPEDQALPWDAWDAYIEELDNAQKSNAAAFRAAVASSGASAGTTNRPTSDATSGVSVGATIAAANRKGEVIPAMPTIPYEPKHRP